MKIGIRKMTAGKKMNSILIKDYHSALFSFRSNKLKNTDEKDFKIITQSLDNKGAA